MNKPLIPLLAVLALPTAVNANWLLEKTLGIYGSRLEAANACRKWQEEGGTYFVKYEAMPSIGKGAWTAERNIRGCKDEEETSKWLGIERTNVKKDETYEPFNLSDPNLRRVAKYFKY